MITEEIIASEGGGVANQALMQGRARIRQHISRVAPRAPLPGSLHRPIPGEGAGPATAYRVGVSDSGQTQGPGQ